MPGEVAATLASWSGFPDRTGQVKGVVIISVHEGGPFNTSEMLATLTCLQQNSTRDMTTTGPIHHVQDPWQRLIERVDEQDWPAGALYVIATPIGNLADLTLRAWQALIRMDVVAAEDTRQSRSLLDAWGVRTPLMAAHRHNEAAAAEAIVQRLQSGERVGLISDAGSPGVSDPGGRIVREVAKAGLRVIPLPGPSAVVSALMACGATSDENPAFAFAGFAPPKASARHRWLRRWSSIDCAVAFYEGPHRIRACLQDMRVLLGDDRLVTCARELTKRFEEIHTFPLSDARSWLDASSHREQGEFVVILHPIARAGQSQDEDIDFSAVDPWVDALLETMSVRDVAKLVASVTGLSKDLIYARVLMRSGK